MSGGTLAIGPLVAGRRLLVFGGTGFLGKVWVSMLLTHYPEVGHLYLVVRPRKGGTPEERFWSEIAPSEAFEPLRQRLGEGFEAFLRDKVTPLAGDVTRPFAGVSEADRAALAGRVDVLVNAAGVVDFNPPLDYALNVNAYGMQALVELSRALGDGLPFLHTSTCYVAGDRTGQVDEVHPLEHPFPRSGELDLAHWDPDREIAECADMVEHVHHRAEDAFRQSAFLAEARQNLRERGEPTRGTALEDELARVRRAYISRRLVEAGLERARFWGWHNVYTYTKSIGEQVLAGSGLPFAIVRPAVIESAVRFPVPGWNEGINTSAPLIYMVLQGLFRFPMSQEAVLDVIPVDMVASGMMLALGELLEGRPKPVYQLGSSDSNPLPMVRFGELVSLYKRRHYREHAAGNPIHNLFQASYGVRPISAETYRRRGPRAIARWAGGAAGILRRAGEDLLLIQPLAQPLAESLDALARRSRGLARVLDQFVPFTSTHNYRFACGNVRAAWARASEADRERLLWDPEGIDWRSYILDVHIPGLEKRVWPRIRERLRREARPLRRHDDLVAFLDEIAERYDRSPALLRTHPDGLTRMSYLELRERARAAARRLRALGVEEGERVLLSGANHPDWVVAWFAIVLAGGVVVPADPRLTRVQAANIVGAAGVRRAVLDRTAAELGDAVPEGVIDLHELAAPGPGEPLPERRLDPDDVVSVIFTSGTTGDPKGVMLTHRNLMSLLGSLGGIFDLGADDRVLSVLPLHHTFEFSCGLLMPLAHGAQVIYLDELTGDRLAQGLQAGRVTAMVGVPALWQLLERRILAQVEDKGPLARFAFDWGLELNRILGRRTGLDAGRILFGSVHRRLGGNIRVLISGGAALPRDTHALFQGLGLHLAEGYGLTEAAPVLTVAQGGPGTRPGTVGRPIPGVEIRILDPDDSGVGEVLARGPNVMKGYFGDRDATRAVIDEEGWLHTGDLGRIDHRGDLVLVGRAKEVVVTAAGENIYLDDVEEQIGRVPYVEEYALAGLPDPRGGERLGLLAVPAQREDLDRASLHARARKALQEAIRKLPSTFRPSVVHLVDAPLPRTATRKVRRKEVSRVLERIAAAAARPSGGGGTVASTVRQAIARVAGVPLERVQADGRMAEDFGFDSLMWVELAAALDDLPGGKPSPEALAACETVADVEELVRAPAPEVVEEPDVRDRVRIPPPLVGPLRAGLRGIQKSFYGNVLDVEVTGRAFIPQDRPTIVVSNHCSHLDMGLVKHALGAYGRKLVALAAKDYFFEGNKWFVAYFEQLTNLQPIDRSGSFRQSYEQARSVIEQGHVVLLFPEGTRRTDGTLGPFKPLVGKLALETGVDVLPLYLEGTFEVLPKGAVVPRGRRVSVRIGPPLEAAELRRITAGLRGAEAPRAAVEVIREAVAALREGRVLDASTLPPRRPERRAPRAADPLAELFEDLASRFRPEEANGEISWYFSLGGEAGRWTVAVRDGKVEVRRGRPPGGRADCVVKTAPELLGRIVREGYTPEPSEFLSGAIKTNDLGLLVRLGQVFRLGPAEEAGR